MHTLGLQGTTLQGKLKRHLLEQGRYQNIVHNHDTQLLNSQEI